MSGATPRLAETASVARPLAGLVVVETGSDLALAMCGKYLAALGAFVVTTESNRLIEFDDAVRQYVDAGKVFSTESCLAPDILLTTDTRSSRPPRTVRVIVSDNGLIGPQSSWLGGDLVAQASSGLLALMGEPGRAPLKLGGHQIDYSTGLAAFTSAMIALTARDADPAGLGQDVQLSRLETAAYIEWKGRVYSQVGNVLTRGEASGPIVTRCQDGYFGFYYRAADWPAVLSVFPSERLREAPFDTHAGRVEQREALAALLSELSAELSSGELYRQLQALGVPAGPVYGADTLLTSPQYLHRSYLVPNDSGAREPALPVEFNGIRPTPKGQA